MGLTKAHHIAAARWWVDHNDNADNYKWIDVVMKALTEAIFDAFVYVYIAPPVVLKILNILELKKNFFNWINWCRRNKKIKQINKNHQNHQYAWKS